MSNTQIASSSNSSSSNMSFVFGNWRTSSPAERDIEAQVIVGSHEPFTPAQIPAPPPSVYAHQPRSSLSSSQAMREEGTDPIDDFFGVTHSGTHDSRHDAYVNPPPYEAEPTEPPAYSEYPTLAMYLFKFGFRTCFLSPKTYVQRAYFLPHFSIPTILGGRSPYPFLYSASTCRVGDSKD